MRSAISSTEYRVLRAELFAAAAAANLSKWYTNSDLAAAADRAFDHVECDGLPVNIHTLTEAFDAALRDA